MFCHVLHNIYSVILQINELTEHNKMHEIPQQTCIIYIYSFFLCLIACIW